MPRQCRETIDMSAVEITCRTTRCSMSQQQAGSHARTYAITAQARSTNSKHVCLPSMENSLLTMAVLPLFSDGVEERKSCHTRHSPDGRPSGQPSWPQSSRGTRWDIMQTVVDFYDSKQRQPNGSFVPPTKESDMVEYEVEVV